MQDRREIRPNSRVFVVRSVFRTAVFTFPLVLVATLVAPSIELEAGAGFGLALVLWFALVAFRFVQRRIIYGKTRYLVYPDRIVLETGGLLNERSVDLQFTNVTRIALTLPFIEHKLYETGHVTVQAAGSAAAEIVIESVDEPRGVFEALTESLRQNGFSIERAETIQQEKPGLVGSIYELGTPIVSAAIVMLFVIPDLLDLILVATQIETVDALLNALASGELLARAAELSLIALLAGVVLMLIFAGGTLGFLGLRWMDILKRTYTLHDDVIDYTDGFLTKRHNFIPVENLTDVEIEEKLVQRVLGISTIKVSCQGAGVDIRLGAVPNGEQFKKNLERLIDESGAPVSSRATHGPAGSHVSSAGPSVGLTGARDVPGREPHDSSAAGGPARRASEPTTATGDRVEGKYDWKRGLADPVSHVLLFGVVFGLPVLALVITVPEAGAAVLPALLIFGVFGIGSKALQILLRAYAVDYAVDPRKVTHKYELFNRKQTEFAVDKISAVDIRTTPLDRWFGTARISFTSIGSEEKVVFEYLENADEVTNAVLSRLRIDPDAVEERRDPDFDLVGLVRSFDPLVLGCAIAALGFAVASIAVDWSFMLGVLPALLGAIARVVYLKLLCDRASLDVGPNWVRVRRGILIRHLQYIPAHHVRGMDARCNVGEPRGVLTVRSGGGASGSLGFLNDVWDFQHSLDDRLHARETGTQIDTTPVSDRDPAVLNAVLRLLVTSVVTVVLLPFLVFTIPWTITATRRIRYELQRSRIVKQSGVFRKRRETILLARIDHLTTSRGALNRLNDTGSIGVRTLGSGGTDLLVRDVPEHREFYEIVENVTKQ